MANFYSAIAWTQAWFASILPSASQVCAAAHWRDEINAQARRLEVRNHQNQPLQFVAQADLPDGVAYEAFISTDAKVPTRENLHDFFNALVWLSFPLIKRQLNALQAAQIASLGVGKSRGAARDAATIFDENAALLVVENSVQGQALVAALRAHDWRSIFIDQRELFSTKTEVWSFGHALMEKLAQPYKAITAHTWIVWVEADYFAQDFLTRRAQVDRRVAEQLTQQPLSTADYTHLPVLGIPGWWSAQDEDFYADASVFRPLRR